MVQKIYQTGLMQRTKNLTQRHRDAETRSNKIKHLSCLYAPANEHSVCVKMPFLRKSYQILLWLTFLLAVTLTAQAQDNNRPIDVKFRAGSATYKGVLRKGESRHYLFTTRKGQRITIRLHCAPRKTVSFELYGTLDNDNQDIQFASNKGFWSGRAPETGDYELTIGSGESPLLPNVPRVKKRAQFTLTITKK